MMQVKKFDLKRDLEKLENYLRSRFIDTQTMQSWLPQRLHDLVYRIDTQATDKGEPKSSPFIYIWENNNEIVGCILPDGDVIYVSTKDDDEKLYEEIVKFAEKKCKPLLKKDKIGDGLLLSIANNDSLKYREKILKTLGYKKQVEEDYDNFVYPESFNEFVDLPKGFKLLYGNEYSDEVNKWSALNMGFHPDLESPDYKNNMNPYNSRKQSSLYIDSFECLVVDLNSKERNNVCSYCFVYVDKDSKTAFIEPVSTREKYRHKKIGTAMLHGVIKKCKEIRVEKCYVNSYDWRKKFYNSAGFKTEDSIGFWTKDLD